MHNLAIVDDHPVWQQEKFSEILILDDSDFDRKRMRRSLSQLPMSLNFTEAADLHMFRQQVRYKSYDLILIDYGLADGDGLDAIRTCKEWGYNNDAFFVMVTGNDSSALAVNALKSGFDDYISKDEIYQDVLSNLLSASAEKKTKLKKIVDFPFSPITERQNQDGEHLEGFAPTSLTEVLEHPIRKAVLAEVTRLRFEDSGDTMASLYGTFFNADEFVFTETN